MDLKDGILRCGSLYKHHQATCYKCTLLGHTPRDSNLVAIGWNQVSTYFFLIFLFSFFKIFIYLFLAALGLRCCTRAFSSCRERGILCCSAPASHCGSFSCSGARGSRRTGLMSCGSRALEHRLSSCGVRALLLHVMWDPPGSGLEPMPPALAGGFPTTAPPGKPSTYFLNQTKLIQMHHQPWEPLRS